MSDLDAQLARARRVAPPPPPPRVRGEPSDRWVTWHATVEERAWLTLATVPCVLLWPLAGLFAWSGRHGVALALGGLCSAPWLWRWITLRIRAPRALPQARALVARLPFDASSYLEALRSPPLVVPWFHHESVELRVRLDFARAPPPGTVETLLALVSASARYSEGAAVVQLSGFNPWPQLEGLLVEVLAPLHAEYPLRSLRVEVERRIERAEGDG